MAGKKAVLAVLLALCLALLPLYSLAASANPQPVGIGLPSPLGGGHRAPVTAESPAVLPSPAAQPCMQDGAEGYHCMLLAASALKNPLHSRWLAGCTAFRSIPHQAERCYTDHPHHAPPRQA